MVDDEDMDRGFGCFDFEAWLLLDCGENANACSIPRSVRRPSVIGKLEVDVIGATKLGRVHSIATCPAES